MSDETGMSINMDQRIIYPTDGGGVAVIIPALECKLSIKEIAAKDVPEGIPYKIVNVEDIPLNRIFRSAWEADFTYPDGYGMGHKAWFESKGIFI